MKFSVITPSFRQLPLLKLCARSVADQEVDLEHIIQDAGTGPELEAWFRDHSSASLYVERDDGMYDAINRGLRRATGEICSWLNCDEQYLPGALEKVRGFFEAQPDTEILFGDALLVTPESDLLSYRRAILPWRSHTRFVHLNTLSCAMFFRRHVFEERPFDPQWRTIGDAVWIYSLLEAGVKMAVLPEALATFAFTGENLSASARGAEEGRQWRGGSWFRHAAPLFSLVHRLRKWQAGAYEKRDVSVEIYAPGSGDCRVTKTARLISSGWPVATQESADDVPANP